MALNPLKAEHTDRQSSSQYYFHLCSGASSIIPDSFLSSNVSLVFFQLALTNHMTRIPFSSPCVNHIIDSFFHYVHFCNFYVSEYYEQNFPDKKNSRAQYEPFRIYYIYIPFFGQISSRQHRSQYGFVLAVQTSRP